MFRCQTALNGRAEGDKDKVCCTNNPQDKQLAPTIYLSWSLRRCETSYGESWLCVCVCVGGTTGRRGRGLSLAWFWSFWPKGAPLCVASTLEQKPRYSGPCFKSNKLLQRFRDDIWRYQHAKPGRGGSTEVTLRAATACSALGGCVSVLGL